MTNQCPLLNVMFLELCMLGSCCSSAVRRMAHCWAQGRHTRGAAQAATVRCYAGGSPNAGEFRLLCEVHAFLSQLVPCFPALLLLSSHPYFAISSQWLCCSVAVCCVVWMEHKDPSFPLFPSWMQLTIALGEDLTKC